MKKENKNKFTYKADVLARNEMHFGVQRRTRAAVFPNGKVYRRKKKHRKESDE